MATHRTLAELLGKTSGKQSTEPKAAPEPEPEQPAAEQPAPAPAAEEVEPPEAAPEPEPEPAALASEPEPTVPAPAPAARRAAETKPARKPVDPPAETQHRNEAQRPDGELRTPEPGAADRVTLYLHPDDHRALGLAKLDDRIDHNTRIRAMIALWRADPDAVNELAARHKSP